MEWSKTKTIFIITFLILDIFLGYQFFEKRSSSQLDLILETTIEEQLEAENITYVDLPKERIKETYISGKRKSFTAEDMNELIKRKQKAERIDENQMIFSVFEEPIPLEDRNAANLNSFVRENILFGEQYTFWNWNEESNKLRFFQTYKDKTIYFNGYGMLTVQLDEENRMIWYEQTLLSEIEDLNVEGNKKEILPALKALEILFQKNDLTYGTSVTRIDLGYFTLVPLSGGTQVFAPTWHVIVDGEKNYFVNAIEGQIQQLDQEDGVEEHELTF